MKLFTILLPLIYTCEYVYICAYIYKSLDCSSYVAIRSGFRVSNRVSVIHGFGFGHEFSPESVFGSVSGFKFGFRFWVPRHSTRFELDPLPSLLPTRPPPLWQSDLLCIAVIFVRHFVTKLHILFASFMSPYIRIWLQILMSVGGRRAFAEV
jgi:hypothetical protein